MDDDIDEHIANEYGKYQRGAKQVESPNTVDKSSVKTNQYMGKKTVENNESGVKEGMESNIAYQYKNKKLMSFMPTMNKGKESDNGNGNELTKTMDTFAY